MQSAARALHMISPEEVMHDQNARSTPASAVPTSPGKFADVAVLVTVVAALAVLFVQSGAVETLNHSSLRQ